MTVKKKSAAPARALTNQSNAKKKPPKVLVADTPSKCFDDVRWKNGVAFATFHKDGSQYAYPMSRSEFKEWQSSDSLGEFFNDQIKE
jgi:hypothetical protein